MKNEGNASETIRLPKWNLPTFSGQLHEWLSYRDIFLSDIHNNLALSASQKLSYWKLSLHADLLRIIQLIPTEKDESACTFRYDIRNMSNFIQSSCVGKTLFTKSMEKWTSDWKFKIHPKNLNWLWLTCKSENLNILQKNKWVLSRMMK